MQTYNLISTMHILKCVIKAEVCEVQVGACLWNQGVSETMWFQPNYTSISMKQAVTFTGGNVLIVICTLYKKIYTYLEGNKYLFVSWENMHELSILVSLHCWMLCILNDLNMNVIY